MCVAWGSSWSGISCFEPVVGFCAVRTAYRQACVCPNPAKPADLTTACQTVRNHSSDAANTGEETGRLRPRWPRNACDCLRHRVKLAPPHPENAGAVVYTLCRMRRIVKKTALCPLIMLSMSFPPWKPFISLLVSSFIFSSRLPSHAPLLSSLSVTLPPPSLPPC